MHVLIDQCFSLRFTTTARSTERLLFLLLFRGPLSYIYIYVIYYNIYILTASLTCLP